LSRTTIKSVESPLEDFCEACLTLLEGESALGSVLTDLLPSFGAAIQPCGLAARDLDSELDLWKKNSQQLIRLAKLHSGSDAEGLIKSLERVSHEATRAIEALTGLGTLPTADSTALDQKPETQAVNNASLRSICESMLVLMKLGPDETSVLAQTMPSLYHIFRYCTPVVMARLRAELNVSRSASEQLLELAGAHYGNAASPLQQRIRESHDCAAKMIGAMESLANAARAERSVKARPSDSPAKPATVKGAETSAAQSGKTDLAQALEYYQLGLQSQQHRDFQTAETLYSEALRLDPTLRLAWLQRGRIRVMHQKGVPAVADLTRALQLFDADPLALRWRGDALAMCGQFADAMDDYQRVLDILPEDTAVRYNRAVVLRLTGRLDRAWSEFEHLRTRRSNLPGTYLNRGLICMARGLPEEAVEEFKAALEAKPGLPEAIERLKELGIATSESRAPAIHPADSKAAITPKPAKTAPPAIAAPGTPRGSRKAARKQASDSSAQEVDYLTKSAGSQSDADQSESPEDKLKHELAMSLLLEISSVEIPQVADQQAGNSPAEIKPLQIDSGDSNGSSPQLTLQAGDSGRSASGGHGASLIALTDKPAGQKSAHSDGSQNEVTLIQADTLEIRCPSCDQRSVLRLNQLRSGKVIACRRCSCHFKVQSNGKLSEVVKNRRGQWEVHHDRFALLRDRRVIAAIVSVSLLLLATTWRYQPVNYDAVIAEDADMPAELESRAEVFTLAWLKGDHKTMRQLTEAVHSKELFLWAMDNPAPALLSRGTLERDVRFKVRILDENRPNARVQVRIDGLQVANGNGISELSQAWRLEGERWKFQPVSNPHL
jgi:tetratricopeptide (TPR) repeat protein/transposase-like protein